MYGMICNSRLTNRLPIGYEYDSWN